MAGLVPNSTGNIRELPPDVLEAMPVDGLEDDDKGSETTTIVVDAKTGAHIIYQSDGSAIIDTQPGSDEDKPEKDERFDANLAIGMSETDLSSLGGSICEGVEADIKTRADFENIFSRAVDLLGIKLEESSGQTSADGTVSKVYHPLLLETTVRYQANFVAEMLPATGPAKVRDDQPEPVPGAPPQTIVRDEIAEDFEKDINHYLTTVATEFYPDTDRMAFSQGLFGNGFKKQYHCPLRRRPVSESIPMQDLIVSNEVTDLRSALRVTHRTKMSQATMIRMQLNKSYRRIELPTPQPKRTVTEEKIAASEGTDPKPQLPSDFQYTILEVMIDIDLKGHEHMEENEDGEMVATGLPLPYIVTVEQDSKTVLAIRRNWEEDDKEFQKKVRIVHYPLIPGLGFYAYGFIQLLGNTSRALTGITRMLLDAGQFATFPGFLMQKGGSKQSNTEMRVNPGHAKEIDTNGKPINEFVMKIPYTEPSPTLEKMRESLGEDGLRLGGAAQIPVGEGRVDVPVGTMMAAVEQLTKTMGAIHKRNHQAQQQELQNLRDLFKEDPSALWKFAKSPQRQWQVAEEFSDLELVPASDPNVPSHVHRIMVATAIIQLAGSPTGMQIYDQKAVHERALRVIGVNDPQSLFTPPPDPTQPPPQDPAIALKNKELDLKAQDQQIKKTEQEREAQDTIVNNQMRAQEMVNQKHIADQKLQGDLAKEQKRSETEVAKEHSKGIAAVAREHVAGINAQKETHLKGVHEVAKAHVEAAHEHLSQSRQHQHEKEVSAKAQESAKAKPEKAEPKPKPKKGKKP